jgi:hypothetical protein
MTFEIKKMIGSPDVALVDVALVCSLQATGDDNVSTRFTDSHFAKSDDRSAGPFRSAGSAWKEKNAARPPPPQIAQVGESFEVA